MVNNCAEKQANLSSDKLLLILETIAKNRMPIRLQNLAEELDMSQSTVLRYLRSLQNSNYVFQDDAQRYALTWKICNLTENLNTHISLRNIANPFVNSLANELQLGVCIVCNQDDTCMYLDCIDYPNSEGTPLRYIGKRAPLHITGSGKLLLSSYSEGRLDSYLATKEFVKFTNNTLTDSDLIKKELAKVREQGFALDNEECEIGIRCISYPIYSFTGSIYAAISVFGNTTDMNDDYIEKEIKPLLQEAASTISQRLGYTPVGH